MKVFLTGASGFIGTNLVARLLADGHEVMNFDPIPALDARHEPHHAAGDIMDKPSLLRAMQGFAPDAVVHLAAKTDTDTHELHLYDLNITGTRNVLECIKATPSVQRSVVTSTQYVIGPGRPYDDIMAYSPHTVYGQSKVETERETFKADLDSTWTIVRPTNIWGPWHPRYPYEFWAVLKKGRYLHPGNERVMKCYGFVGTVVDQIVTILESPREKVHRQVFYVGDAPIDLRDWVREFSLAITGRPPRVVPTGVVRVLAKFGDVVKAAGGRFPIFTSRYHSMTEEYMTPIERTTFPVLGPPKADLKEGVRITKAWLDEYEGRLPRAALRGQAHLGRLKDFRFRILDFGIGNPKSEIENR